MDSLEFIGGNKCKKKIKIKIKKLHIDYGLTVALQVYIHTSVGSVEYTYGKYKVQVQVPSVAVKFRAAMRPNTCKKTPATVGSEI